MSHHTKTAFWVNTVSRGHVRKGGFTQADHGAATRLKKLRRGDELIFYSPRPAAWPTMRRTKSK